MKTSAAGFQPRTRRALEKPMLPLPYLRISTPAQARPMSTPKGMLPQR